MSTTIEPEAEADDAGDGEIDQPEHETTTSRRLLWFVATFAVLLLVHSFVVEPVRVRSDSMEPTVPSGAILLIDKISTRIRDPHRGEIVVTSDPQTGASIVKRVVAIAGDSVGIDNGQLVVNGVKVVEPYINNDEMDGFYFGPDLVPAGHVFLLGDNRATSHDSRSFGPVDVDAIDGRLLATIWPVS